MNNIVVRIVNVQLKALICEQDAANIGVVNELIRDYHTDRVVRITEGCWEFKNFDSSLQMQVYYTR